MFETIENIIIPLIDELRKKVNSLHLDYSQSIDKDKVYVECREKANQLWDEQGYLLFVLDELIGDNRLAFYHKQFTKYEKGSNKYGQLVNLSISLRPFVGCKKDHPQKDKKYQEYKTKILS